MDAPALASLERAGLVGVIAGVVGWGVLAYIEWSGATSASVSRTASGAPHLALSTGTVAAILVLAAIGGLLQMIGLWYYLGAFRALRQADDTFETPSKLVPSWSGSRCSRRPCSSSRWVRCWAPSPIWRTASTPSP
jgi:hypothetical protein